MVISAGRAVFGVVSKASMTACSRGGVADPAATGQISAAMSERKTQACMNMANLNLQQCVAAANQQYEVPFCIGEHALADVGKCIGGVYQ